MEDFNKKIIFVVYTHNQNLSRLLRVLDFYKKLSLIEGVDVYITADSQFDKSLLKDSKIKLLILGVVEKYENLSLKTYQLFYHFRNDNFKYICKIDDDVSFFVTHETLVKYIRNINCSYFSFKTYYRDYFSKSEVHHISKVSDEFAKDFSLDLKVHESFYLGAGPFYGVSMYSLKLILDNISSDKIIELRRAHKVNGLYEDVMIGRILSQCNIVPKIEFKIVSCDFHGLLNIVESLVFNVGSIFKRRELKLIHGVVNDNKFLFYRMVEFTFKIVSKANNRICSIFKRT